MVVAPKVGADQSRAIKMALVHDIGEAEIGDVVTMIGRRRLPNLAGKIKKERAALARILSLVDGEDYISLFDEYEEDKTKEARLIKQLDKLEMVIQAHEYEKDGKMKLEEFFETARHVVHDKYLKEILSEVESLRSKR